MARNLMKASGLWSTRKASETFWSAQDAIDNHLNHVMAPSACKVIGAFDPRREDDEENGLHLRDLHPVVVNGDIQLAGKQGQPYPLTHWAMAQLCTWAGIPADLVQTRLARHPDKGAELLDLCMRDKYRVPDPDSGTGYTEESRGDKRVSVLLQKLGVDSPLHIRAVTGHKYSRIWDRDLFQYVADAGRNAGWKTPPARPSPSRADDPRIRPATQADLIDWGGNQGGGAAIGLGDQIGPAGVYIDDRQSNIIVVNPNKVIDSGADDGGLFQAVIIGNSEVRHSAFFVLDCLLEMICGNHIFWGVENESVARLIHKGDANVKWREILDSVFTRYDDRRSEQLAKIKAARALILGDSDEEVKKRLNKRFNLTGKAIAAALEIAKINTNASGADPRSAWAIVEALTRYSQTFPYAEQRYSIDRAAGDLLMSVAV